MNHRLGFRRVQLPREESYGFLGRNTRLVEISAYRWTIDGADIAEWVSRHRRPDGPVTPADDVAWLADDPLDACDRITRLLGGGIPDLGVRTALLVCPICAGLGCGAFSAEVAFADTSVSWRALGYDSGSDGQPTLLFDPALAIHFERRQYVSVLTSALQAAMNPAP